MSRFARGLRNSLKPGAVLGVAAMLAAACGCGHGVSTPRPLNELEYYFDNDLPFHPSRIWKIRVHWDPYLISDSKALVVKHFQYIVREPRDRARLETEIAERGGDERYLRWFESELVPLGSWETRDDAGIGRFADRLVVSFTSKALKEVAKSGQLTLDPIDLPDPVLRAVNDGCPELSWEVIPKNDSLGIEVVLQSRKTQPNAVRWQRYDEDGPVFFWRSWSVGRETSIAYRTAIQFKATVSRCPLPPKIQSAFRRLLHAQPMGVDW